MIRGDIRRAAAEASRWEATRISPSPLCMLGDYKLRAGYYRLKRTFEAKGYPYYSSSFDRSIRSSHTFYKGEVAYVRTNDQGGSYTLSWPDRPYTSYGMREMPEAAKLSRELSNGIIRVTPGMNSDIPFPISSITVPAQDINADWFEKTDRIKKLENELQDIKDDKTPCCCAVQQHKNCFNPDRDSTGNGHQPAHCCYAEIRGAFSMVDALVHHVRNFPPHGGRMLLH